MHIGDGLLTGPTCLATGALAFGGLAFALKRVACERSDRMAPLMGVVAACVFAAQMLNFPILAPVSGHPLGGVLAAVLLGPWAAIIVLTVVLGVQCLVFQDGGITALGANALNVAILGPLAGYCIWDAIRRLWRGPAGMVAGSVVAAWFGVMLGAIACSVEVAIRADTRLASILGVMLLFHSLIGIGEAIVTGLAVTYVLRTRPDLIHGQAGGDSTPRRLASIVVAGSALALAMVVILSPWASSSPDGLEAALERVGIASQPPAWTAAPLADYQIRTIRNVQLGGVAAGTIGTVLTFGVAFVLGRRALPVVKHSHASHAS